MIRCDSTEEGTDRGAQHRDGDNGSDLGIRDVRPVVYEIDLCSSYHTRVISEEEATDRRDRDKEGEEGFVVRSFLLVLLGISVG